MSSDVGMELLKLFGQIISAAVIVLLALIKYFNNRDKSIHDRLLINEQDVKNLKKDVRDVKEDFRERLKENGDDSKHRLSEITKLFLELRK